MRDVVGDRGDGLPVGADAALKLEPPGKAAPALGPNVEARGIGAATARIAGARGYKVAVNYRERRDAADQVVADIEAAGGKAGAFRGDVGVEADVVRLFNEVDEKLGPLTALVNSAGITGNGTAVADYSADALNRLMAVNVMGTMLCCREAVRRMSTKKGGAGGAIVSTPPANPGASPADSAQRTDIR